MAAVAVVRAAVMTVAVLRGGGGSYACGRTVRTTTVMAVPARTPDTGNAAVPAATSPEVKHGETITATVVLRLAL